MCVCAFVFHRIISEHRRPLYTIQYGNMYNMYTINAIWFIYYSKQNELTHIAEYQRKLAVYWFATLYSLNYIRSTYSIRYI